MKRSINKAFLASLPPAVAEIVETYRKEKRKNFVSFFEVPEIYFVEDSRVTLHNVENGMTGRARVAGEFAGPAGLRPSGSMPLFEGLWCIETGICHGWWMTISKGTAPRPVEQANVINATPHLTIDL